MIVERFEGILKVTKMSQQQEWLVVKRSLFGSFLPTFLLMYIS